MIKNASKNEHRRKRPQHNKGHVQNKPTANIILSGENLKAFPLRSGARNGAHSHHYYSTKFWKPQQCNQRRKRIKGIQIGKEVKLSLLDTVHRKP